MQTQGEGVTTTWAVSPEVSFPACGWGLGEQCLKRLLKLVSLQVFVSFHHVTWRPELGEVGGRSGLSASWAGQAWALPGGLGSRGTGFQGAGPACPALCCSCSPSSPPRSGEGRGLREVGLGSSSAESLLSTQPELGL